MVLFTHTGKIDHVAIAHVLIATLVVRDQIETFKSPYIIRAHKAILNTDGIAVHAALIIASEEAVHIEFHEIVRLFRLTEKRTVK